MLKRRHLYVLLFAAPALLASIIAVALMLAVSAGALWLFLLGDNPWPPLASTLLGVVFFLGGAVLWLALLRAAWAVGKRQEGRPTLSIAHVALALGATAALGALVGGHVTGKPVWRARSDSLVCADACRAEGFTGSGMPPTKSGDRTCRCYDGQGKEAKRLDLSAVGVRPGPAR